MRLFLISIITIFIVGCSNHGPKGSIYFYNEKNEKIFSMKCVNVILNKNGGIDSDHCSPDFKYDHVTLDLDKNK